VCPDTMMSTMTCGLTAACSSRCSFPAEEIVEAARTGFPQNAQNLEPSGSSFPQCLHYIQSSLVSCAEPDAAGLVQWWTLLSKAS
jgi:hypothetical protein